MYRIYDGHEDRLPFVRIKRMELMNFKGVQHGIIDFNCAKEFTAYDTKSDILGLYGQNGSGKSSLVEAISLIKGLIGGFYFNSESTKYIDVEADYAYISIDFDFQYKDGTVATVCYEVKLEVKEKKEVALSADMSEIEQPKQYIAFYDEIVKTDMYADGSIGRMHKIVDTKDEIFCAKALENDFFEADNTSVKEELSYIKRKTFEDSQSFVFSNILSEIINIRNTEENHSKYYEILSELVLFASKYLYVINTRTNGLVQLRAGIPIYIPGLGKPFVLSEKSMVNKETYDLIKNTINQINNVVSAIIPGLSLSISGIPTIMENGEDGFYIKILSLKEGKMFPFEYESDGIIKIVSILADYIFAFNQGSATLVVDEFDSGVFEFLLGELLQIFEEYGKGQLIFTSHNLRPLEVINKKFIRFTTSDPQNRYYKLKNIGNTNNLRDVYLREIRLGNQDIEIYKRTKSFKIAKALKSASLEVDYEK